VDAAVELGTDPDRRRAASEAISDCSDVLFEDESEILDLEAGLSSLVGSGRATA
jgi:hypothetical protein